MRISEDIRYAGEDDHHATLFESQFPLPNGIAYNSFVILDEKIAVLNTVDMQCSHEWFYDLDMILKGKTPDYLIIQHMEPDHSSCTKQFIEKYENAVVVAGEEAFRMMKNYYGLDLTDRQLVMADGDLLSLGKHTLTFIAAPMVHWPEVFVIYDNADKVVFTADAFGKFGVLDIMDDWISEARRYYFAIIGKYGSHVQLLLEKLALFDIRIICPLHGPILTDNLDYYVGLYNTWSSYASETDGVMIAYTSVYGGTASAVHALLGRLSANGIRNVHLCNLVRYEMSRAVSDAFRFSKLVLATTTYNGDIFPQMREFIYHLTARGIKNKTIGFIENGSWAPQATKIMQSMLSDCSNMTYIKKNVRLISTMNEENKKQIDQLADEMTCKKKTFVCSVCGYVYEGDTLPENFTCPICGEGSKSFKEDKTSATCK